MDQRGTGWEVVYAFRLSVWHWVGGWHHLNACRRPIRDAADMKIVLKSENLMPLADISKSSFSGNDLAICKSLIHILQYFLCSGLRHNRTRDMCIPTQTLLNLH